MVTVVSAEKSPPVGYVGVAIGSTPADLADDEFEVEVEISEAIFRLCTRDGVI